MKFYNNYIKGAEILIDDLIYYYFDPSLDKDRIITNMVVVLRYIDRHIEQKGLNTVTKRTFYLLKRMTFEDMQNKYNELKESNFKPQIVKVKETESKQLSLFEILKDTPKLKEIYLKHQTFLGSKYQTFYKINLFQFENDYYVALKDQESNINYYKYSKYIDNSEKENESLSLIKDHVLINLFNELGFNK